MPSLSQEMSVPAFALPGAPQLWAWRLHNGTRQKFKATVIKLRKMVPRIVVRFDEAEDGSTNRLALPDPITANLFAYEVEEIQQ